MNALRKEFSYILPLKNNTMYLRLCTGVILFILSLAVFEERSTALTPYFAFVAMLLKAMQLESICETYCG